MPPLEDVLPFVPIAFLVALAIVWVAVWGRHE